MPKAGSTTWVYNMLMLAESQLVNTSSTTSSGRKPSSTDLSSSQSSERGSDSQHAFEKSDTGLSEDDLMHVELRRHYPVPKNLKEVEKQALTFHVVRLEEMLK